MTKRSTILFDFDGTIADSFEQNFDIYNELSKKFNYKPISREKREQLRDKRPQELLEIYGITKMKLPLLLLHGRKKLRKKIGSIKPIEGIEEVLRDLQSKNFQLGILTSNSKKNVRIFLEKNKMEGIFEFIHSGRHFFGKSNSIKRILRKRKISKKSIIYVGDETRDIEACQKAKIAIVAVSWGYNTLHILNYLNPNKSVETPSKLGSFLKEFFRVK